MSLSLLVYTGILFSASTREEEEEGAPPSQTNYFIPGISAKGDERQLLCAEGRVKAVSLTRSMTREEVEGAIREVFGCQQLHYLYCQGHPGADGPTGQLFTVRATSCSFVSLNTPMSTELQHVCIIHSAIGGGMVAGARHHNLQGH